MSPREAEAAAKIRRRCLSALGAKEARSLASRLSPGESGSGTPAGCAMPLQPVLRSSRLATRGFKGRLEVGDGVGGSQRSND